MPSALDPTLLELERINDKIQVGLLGFGVLHIMLSLAMLVLTNTFFTAFSLSTPEELKEMGEFAILAPSFGLFKLFIMGSIGFGLLVVLGATWQARNTHTALQNQLRWPGKTHAAALRKQIRIVQGWLLAAKVLPTALVALTALLILIGTDSKTESPLAAMLSYVAGQALTLLLNWLALNAIGDWFKAVDKHMLGNKNMIHPVTGRVSAWFIATLIPLAMQVVAFGMGIFVAYMISPSSTRKMGLKSNLTALEAGLLSQMSGSMLMCFLVGIVIAVLCMLLLIWSRQLALTVSNRLDMESASRRNPAQPQHNVAATPNQMPKARRLGL